MNTIPELQAKAYYKEWLSNGYNKTQAYIKVHPNTSYDVANSNSTRFHDNVMVKASINEFQELLKRKIPIVTIVKAIQQELTTKGQTKSGIDHYLSITGYTEPEKHQSQVNITQEDRTILNKYIDTKPINRSSPINNN